MTGEHVPAFPVTSQASHSPVHAALQHKPSTQIPETHWVPVVQAVPLLTFGTQAPLSQKLPVEQSVFAVQVVLQAVVPQT